MTRRLLVAALISISAFAQPATETLPLMPWPATVQPANGSGAGVPITSGFSVALEGAGSSDTRVKEATLRFLIRLRRQTGVRTLARLAPSEQGATMVVHVEGKDHKGAQKLGDDESYSLVVNDSRIRLSAGRPLGALRGMETVLQLVRQAPVQGGAATLGFTVIPSLSAIHRGFPGADSRSTCHATFCRPPMSVGRSTEWPQ